MHFVNNQKEIKALKCPECKLPVHSLYLWVLCEFLKQL